MSCKNCNHEGKCELFNPDYEEGLGCDEEGNCTCEDDPNPEESCSSYEELEE